MTRIGIFVAAISCVFGVLLLASLSTADDVATEAAATGTPAPVTQAADPVTKAADSAENVTAQAVQTEQPVHSGQNDTVQNVTVQAVHAVLNVTAEPAASRGQPGQPPVTEAPVVTHKPSDASDRRPAFVTAMGVTLLSIIFVLN